jgi:flavin reductase (DIM6/NTAB) family NADH-FMN oxidoreductase RutF
MKIFGSNHGDKVAKFDLAQVRFDWAKIAKVPILAEASAAYVCRKINQVEAGDHFIFIGEVVEAYIDPKQKTLINVGKRAEGERYIEV